jgi:hypothetical protein
VILNSYIILTSYGSKLFHRNFRYGLVRDLLEESGRVLGPQTTSQGTLTLFYQLDRSETYSALARKRDKCRGAE